MSEKYDESIRMDDGETRTVISKYESVDHPSHYHPGDYEAIKVIEAWLGPEGCYHSV